jgi:hypothetical protein
MKVSFRGIYDAFNGFNLMVPLMRTVRMSDCCLQGIEPCKWKGKKVPMGWKSGL